MNLVSSYYDPETKTSKVTIRHNQDTFSAETVLREEDADVESSFAGCNFAETKAIIKMYRKKLQDSLKELKYLENLYEQMTHLRDFDKYEHSRPMQFLRKKIKIMSQQVMVNYMNYEELKNHYPEMINFRLSTARDIQKQAAIPQMSRAAINQKLLKELEEYNADKSS